MRLACTAVSLGLVAVLTTACSEDPSNEANPDTRTGSPASPSASDDIAVEEVASGLETPWGLAPLDDGGLLVGSRDSGEILLVPPGGGEPRVVGTVDDVRAEGESGLLGLALGSDDTQLLAFRTGETENSVVRMTWDGTTLGEPEEIVSGIPGGATFHQGGAIAIGPRDGLLYLGTGDNGVPEDAQDPDSLSGKVLRYNVDGSQNPGNPEATPVYSLGHRNVEGLVFDDDGRLWASEFGQDRFDELNLVEVGANYGWPEVEGTGGGEEYVDPAAVWSTDDASPSGIAWWDGSLWLAALQGERLWEVRPEGPDATTVADPVGHLTGRYGRIRNAVASKDGETLWVVNSNTDGRGDPDEDDDLLLAITR